MGHNYCTGLPRITGLNLLKFNPESLVLAEESLWPRGTRHPCCWEGRAVVPVSGHQGGQSSLIVAQRESGRAELQDRSALKTTAVAFLSLHGAAPSSASSSSFLPSVCSGLVCNSEVSPYGRRGLGAGGAESPVLRLGKGAFRLLCERRLRSRGEPKRPWNEGEVSGAWNKRGVW